MLDVFISQEMFCRMSSTLHKCCWMLSILHKCPNFPLKGASQPNLNQAVENFYWASTSRCSPTNCWRKATLSIQIPPNSTLKSYKLSFQYIFTEDIKDTELQFGIAKHFPDIISSSMFWSFCVFVGFFGNSRLILSKSHKS